MLCAMYYILYSIFYILYSIYYIPYYTIPTTYTAIYYNTVIAI